MFIQTANTFSFLKDRFIKMSGQPMKPTACGPKINTPLVSFHKRKMEDTLTLEGGNEAFRETERENIKFYKPRRT